VRIIVRVVIVLVRHLWSLEGNCLGCWLADSIWVKVSNQGEVKDGLEDKD
jgi:hypothetical protein